MVDVLTHLMFQDGRAREAAEWYVSLVPGSGIERVVDNGDGRATVYFTLTMAAETAAVVVDYVAFAEPASTPDADTSFLESAIEDARIRKTELVGRAA